MRERTRQQRDPVGSTESRRLWVLLAAGSAAYAVAMTALAWPTTRHHWLAILGALLAVVAAWLAIHWTSDGRSPFTRHQHLAVHVLALAATACALWARHDNAFDINVASFTFTIAGLIFALSPYRPPNELIAAGGTTAMIAGFLVLCRVHPSAHALPDLVLTITAITPIIALTIGAATYTESILRSIESARHHSRALTHHPEENDHRDRVTVMTKDALPLLQRVLESNAITPRDRDNANHAADTLRGMLVSEINRTWLRASQDDRPGPRFIIDDTDSLARTLTATQRTVLRALLDAFANEPGFTGGHLSLTRDGSHHRLTIEAAFDATEYATPPGHPVVSSLLDVMRRVFTEHESHRTQSRVLVAFGYEQE